MRRDLDLLARRDPIRDPVGQFRGDCLSRPLDVFLQRVEREHMRGVLGEADRQPAVAAAELENALPAEVPEPSQRREMRTLGVEDRAHVTVDGL